MILRPCKSQGGDSETVEKLYSSAGFDPEMTAATVSILRRVQEDTSGKRVWGLISMGSIVLLAENVYHSHRFVQFYAMSRTRYSVSYLLPDSYHPWHTLKAEATSEDIAVTMILEAMELSGGWSSTTLEGPEESSLPEFACEAPLDQSEILRLLQEVQLPGGVRTVPGGQGEVTLTQGPPTFVSIFPWYIYCWAPPYEVPWPDSRYEGSYRTKQQAVALIESALQKWPDTFT